MVSSWWAGEINVASKISLKPSSLAALGKGATSVAGTPLPTSLFLKVFPRREQA